MTSSCETSVREVVRKLALRKANGPEPGEAVIPGDLIESIIGEFGAEGFGFFVDEFVREDEFTCHDCNLVLLRSRLVDEERILCEACAERAGAPVPVSGGPAGR